MILKCTNFSLVYSGTIFFAYHKYKYVVKVSSTKRTRYIQYKYKSQNDCLSPVFHFFITTFINRYVFIY